MKMKKYIVDTKTQTVLNLIVIDSENPLELPEGQEYRDIGEVGDKGQFWDGEKWRYTDERLEADARSQRDNKLKWFVDELASNSIRWNSLSEVEQQDVSNYREALLDIPQQPGFPVDITWPVEPPVITALRAEKIKKAKEARDRAKVISKKVR